MGADTAEKKMEEHFNSMIQQRYQFPQMAGWLLLTYIGGRVKRQSKPPQGRTVSTSKGSWISVPRTPHQIQMERREATVHEVAERYYPDKRGGAALCLTG